MIARYSRPQMSEIWSERSKYKLWLEVELSVCDEMAREKLIPKKDWIKLKKACEKLLANGGLDPERVEHHEKVTRHDVIAFTTALAEKVGPVSRYVHFGLTSSDVVDSALALQLQAAGRLILEDVASLIQTLKRLAREHQKVATIGRSHGIFAEPTAFGLKFLGWHEEWKRNQARLQTSLEGLRFGKLSGAVGVNAHWSPAQEIRILKTLGLKREPVSTQVIPRDRHAEFMCTLAILGSSMERAAVELRHLQRSEVGEVMEGFQKGQKGSSAMPHKRNPISTENLTGCARMLRSYSHAALENIALWHERDISHSSVERVFLSDACILMDYSLTRFQGVLNGLHVNEQRVQENLERAGKTSFSGHFLLALVQKGMTRENAYRYVQECALESLERGTDFIRLLGQHPQITKALSKSEIVKLGSLDYQLRHVDQIYKNSLDS